MVSNASPIINLAAIGQLDLLRVLYERVVVPQAVCREILAGAEQPGAHEVQAFEGFATQSCHRRELIAALQVERDAGEAEAVALAVETEADLVLIDERRGRRAARRLGLRWVGLLGVLIEAKRTGHIATIRPLLDALRMDAGFWISESLYREVLEAAGEDTAG